MCFSLPNLSRFSCFLLPLPLLPLYTRQCLSCFGRSYHRHHLHFLPLSLFTFYCFLSITIFLLSFLLLLWNGADFSVQQQLHFDAGETAVAWLL